MTVNNFKKIKCWWLLTAKENFASDFLYEKNKTEESSIFDLCPTSLALSSCAHLWSLSQGKRGLAGVGVGTGVLMGQPISLVAIYYNQMCVIACFTFSMYVLLFTELMWNQIYWKYFPFAFKTTWKLSVI